MTDESEQKRTVIDGEIKEKILERFEEAWRRGEQPVLDDYVPINPTLRQAVLGELVQIDLQRRLKAGQDVGVEDYLKRYPELQKEPSQVLELIDAEYAILKQDPKIRLADYLQRFPHLNEEIQARFPAVTLPDHPQTARVDGLPARFGRYQILRKLGSGAMGDVYHAYDTYLQRSVALKVPAFSRGDKDAIDRFLSEAKAAAHLHHPHLCPVYEAGEIEGTPYFTMAYIEGRPLSRAYELPLPARPAAELVRQLALALAHAHENQIVHRDLKPTNIMIDARHEPIILDFGLALRLTPQDIRATLPGTLMGTPAYMAPEQALGQTDLMGVGCDIFSLGVIFYELLTGRTPFIGNTIREVMDKVAYQQAPPPATFCPGLDPRLQEICLKALAKRIEQRYASMTDFAAALQAWLNQADPVSVVEAAKKPAPQVDPRFVEEAMALIREWGWERTLEMLKERIRVTTDEAKQAGLRLLVGWLAGERGWDEEALAQFRDSAAWPSLAGWALIGEAFVAMRQKNFEAARSFLEEARKQGDPQDDILQGARAHLSGALASHQGKLQEARQELHAALEKFGPDHFTTGRVLDSLGMLAAIRNNFRLASEFYTQGIAIKQRFHDDAGVALGHGQLGRLCLDWGQLEQADDHFRQGIELARRIGDERGEAQLYNHRAQVLLLQGKPAEAEVLLNETIRSARGRWPVIEGYGHKDLALAYLDQNDHGRADQECNQAETLFKAAGFAEGSAHVLLVRGLIRQGQGQYDAACRCLREAASRFEQWVDLGYAARAHWQLSRALRQRGTATVLVAEALGLALDQAERSRREQLVTAIQKDMQEAVPLEFVRRTLRGITFAGTLDRVEEVVTVLGLELREQDGGAEGPLARLERWNDLFAEIEDVLAKREIKVIQYRGESLLALCRGREHARRAIRAALEVVRTLEDFNRPRRVLGWPEWHVAQALATGVVCIDKVGTCRKFDRTAVGTPVQLVFRLLAEADSSQPCLDEATFAAAGASCTLRADSPRTVNLKGFGVQQVWDLTGA